MSNKLDDGFICLLVVKDAKIWSWTCTIKISKLNNSQHNVPLSSYSNQVVVQLIDMKCLL